MRGPGAEIIIKIAGDSCAAANITSTYLEELGPVEHVYNPRAGQAETGRSLEWAESSRLSVRVYVKR